MTALLKKSKVVFSAVSILLCGWSVTDARIEVRQQQSLDVQLKAIIATSHATLNRVRNRREPSPQISAFAIVAARPGAAPLPSSGVALDAATESYDPLNPRGPSARAPPIS
jgi:hypothetical protein